MVAQNKGTASQAIGIFDSGIGGLTVLKEIRNQLPSEDIVYLGDTARVPFGTKSPETVLKFTIQNSLFLLEQGVKALVIACNTASAYSLESLQKFFSVPVIGVIEPGASSAVSKTKNRQIGVIGTEGTIRSQAYPRAIAKLDAAVKTKAKACPLLVSLAEEGWLEGEVPEKVLGTYLAEFRGNGIDTLILGCTHYPLFKPVISKVLGSEIQIVDSAVETARQLNETLHDLHLKQTENRRGQTKIFCTDAPERVARVGRYFLGDEIPKVTKVELS
ncbi:MAG: glutamate racemase [Deltaproteobacteria bacterium]|nr:glutamate racemase [Deltaproteobacteria bacterium]